MAVTDMDLEVRSRQLHRIHIGIAGAIIAAGVLLMITIALLPVGLILFVIGLAWIALLMLIGHADRNRRETNRSPSE